MNLKIEADLKNGGIPKGALKKGGNMDIVQIAEELLSKVGGLQNAEKELINLPTATNIRAMNRQKIVSELYLTKQLQTAVDKTIASNEKLATATDRHAKAMRWLTVALVVVGAVHAVLAMLPTP